MSVAERIKDLRKKKGDSQEQLSFVLGVSRQAISKWESGQSMPDIENIIILSDYFDVTTDYILKGIKSSNQNKHRYEQEIVISFMIVFALIVGIVGFVSNRFRWIEIILMMGVASTIGYGVGLATTKFLRLSTKH